MRKTRPPVELDSVDRLLLAALQEDGRASNVALARKAGMAPSAVLERVRKLEQRGVIQGYEARLDPAALDQSLVAFVFVQAAEKVGGHKTTDRLAALPSVLEVHEVAGEDCVLVKLRVSDPESLGAILREEIGSIPTVRSTRTTVVLRTVKETARLTLPGPE